MKQCESCYDYTNKITLTMIEHHSGLGHQCHQNSLSIFSAPMNIINLAWTVPVKNVYHSIYVMLFAMVL